MNRDWILFNLREAQEALGKLINQVQADSDYDYGSYVVDMSHIYDHINTAWNGRDASEERVRICSEEDFYAWRQLPPEDEIYLGP